MGGGSSNNNDDCSCAKSIFYDNINNEYYFKMSQSTLTFIIGLFILLLICNILLLCDKIFYSKNKYKQYNKVKYNDTDSEVHI